MSIQQRQNLTQSIDKLAAQRLLYSRAKFTRNIGVLLVLAIAVAALASACLQNKNISYIVAISALFAWFLDMFVLKSFETKFKREAAEIQEDFDCNVLDLPWPDSKRVERPTGDRVRQLATKARENPKLVKNLKDWYTPSSIPNGEVLAKLHCQRTNCWWDVGLRKRWRAFLVILFWSFVTIAILLSVFTGISVAELIALVASGLKFLAWGIAELRDQKSAIANLQGLHKMLSEADGPPAISDTELRRFQDEIFDHRKTNPPIPDWFFWFYRDKQEAQA